MAHSIDYVAMSISPASSFNGNSGNFTVNAPVAGGASISFDLTFNINTQGSTTTYPRAVTFGASTEVKPAGAADAQVTGLNSHTFTSATGTGSTFTDSVTITAPATPGAYTVRIQTTSGTGGQNGLSGGGGITVTFTVAEPTECQPQATVLDVGDLCVLLHQQEPVDLTATLMTTGNEPVSGQIIEFWVDGTPVGQALTGDDGIAVLEDVDVSGLAVGDHDVTATYAGQACEFLPTNGIGHVGVSYVFVGFQQPINADGTSRFGGRTVPVKIKIADALGQPVPDAEAHVFFAFGTPAVVGTDAEPLANTSADFGNLMRYDPMANQYVFNWDVIGLESGTYTVRVDLGEGTCGAPHSVTLSLQRKGR